MRPAFRALRLLRQLVRDALPFPRVSSSLSRQTALGCSYISSILKMHCPPQFMPPPCPPPKCVCVGVCLCVPSPSPPPKCVSRVRFMDCSPPSFSVHGISQAGINIGASCPFSPSSPVSATFQVDALLLSHLGGPSNIHFNKSERMHLTVGGILVWSFS